MKSSLWQMLGAAACAGFVVGVTVMGVRDKLRYSNEPWEVRLYQPDAVGQGILLASDGSPAINCGSKGADKLVCMSKEHFGELVSKFRGYRAACPAPAP